MQKKKKFHRHFENKIKKTNKDVVEFLTTF